MSSRRCLFRARSIRNAPKRIAIGQQTIPSHLPIFATDHSAKVNVTSANRIFKSDKSAVLRSSCFKTATTRWARDRYRDAIGRHRRRSVPRAQGDKKPRPTYSRTVIRFRSRFPTCRFSTTTTTTKHFNVRWLSSNRKSPS